MSHRIKTVAIAATASALTVVGMAGAHGGDGKGDRHSAPAFAGSPLGKSLTYSETHLRKDGEDVTVRVDQGRVLASTASSISIRRNDGETVEVPVDGDTRVWGGWWWHKGQASAAHRKHGDGDMSVADIPEGKRVLVLRSDDDEAAEAVTVAKRHRHFHHHDHDGSRHDRDDD
jgi:hypothetical protein